MFTPYTSSGKGKAVAFAGEEALPSPPPLRSLNVEEEYEEETEEDMEDWRRFREAGLLDEAALRRKDRLALAERVSRLQRELCDYQYNMGLLLLEKKEWTLKHEDLKQAVAEVQELLKREQSAHLIAVSEAEKRVENLANALRSKKQSVADLEKALRQMCDGREQNKLESEKKLSDANALIAGVEDKSLDVKEKLHDAEVKLDEVNRKVSELDMRMQEVEARESVILREHLSLKAEEEAFKATLYMQREDLREWERALQQREKKLSEDQRSVKEREEKLNEYDRIFKKKDKNLEEREKSVELFTPKLKEREIDVDKRFAELEMKEKELDFMGNILHKKEEDFRALEEKLNVRERVEIQKLLDERKASLDSEILNFELELKEKGKALDNELRSKAEELERREIELNHKEQKLGKRELAMDSKTGRVKEKERDFKVRVKTLKEKEKFMKAGQKKLELEKKQLLSDRDGLPTVKEEIEKIKADVHQSELKIKEESSDLRIYAEQRSEHLRLLEELKKEIQKCQDQKEVLLKNSDEMKEEKEKFKKEWEVLDEKRLTVDQEKRRIADERERFVQWQLSEEERLKRQKDEMEENFKRELEAVTLERESFAAKKQHEESSLSNKSQDEHNQIRKDLDMMRRDLELSLQNLEEEAEEKLSLKEREFEMQRERDLNNISKLKEEVQTEIDELRSKSLKIQGERENLSLNKEQLNQDQIKIREDINQLVTLNQKLRGQREALTKERGHFLACVEKIRDCQNCGDKAREMMLFDPQSPEMVDNEILSLPRIVDELAKSPPIPFGGTLVKESPSGLDCSILTSGNSMSWLQKCTSRIFNLSPNKMIGATAGRPKSLSSETGGEREVEPALPVHTKGMEGHFTVESDPRSSDEIARRKIIAKEVKPADFVNKLDNSHEVSFGDRSHLAGHTLGVTEEFSRPESESTWSNAGKKHHGAYRTRSVKAVVQDAQIFLDNSSQVRQPNAAMQQDAVAEAEVRSRPTSTRRTSRSSRKRQHAESSQMTETEQDDVGSEGPSDSITAGGGKKRRQVSVSTAPSPHQRRYNLRQHKATASAVPASADLNKGEREENGEVDGEMNSEANSLQPTEANEYHKNSRLAQVTTLKIVEITQENTVAGEDIGDDSANAARLVEESHHCEDINVDQEFYDKDENGSTMHEEEDDYEDETKYTGAASIGKKIWTFFTS